MEVSSLESGPGFEDQAAGAVFAGLALFAVLEGGKGLAGGILVHDVGRVGDVAQVSLVQAIEACVVRVQLGAQVAGADFKKRLREGAATFDQVASEREDVHFLFPLVPFVTACQPIEDASLAADNRAARPPLAPNDE